MLGLNIDYKKYRLKKSNALKIKLLLLRQLTQLRKMNSQLIQHLHLNR